MMNSECPVGPASERESLIQLFWHPCSVGAKAIVADAQTGKLSLIAVSDASTSPAGFVEISMMTVALGEDCLSV